MTDARQTLFDIAPRATLFGSPYNVRHTTAWCVTWTCGHNHQCVADKHPSQCPTCGCESIIDRAAYPVRMVDE